MAVQLSLAKCRVLRHDKILIPRVSISDKEIRSLIELLESQGLIIRREKLRSGSGFRVMSGVCRVDDSHLLFVDRRLSLDEQLEVLRDAKSALGGVARATRPAVSEAA